MRKYLLALTFLFYGLTLIGQQPEYTNHTVKSGETVYGICKQYNISIAELEKYNPDVKNGLKENMLLLIPKATSVSASRPTEKKFVTHKVEPGQTLYSICKLYKVSQADLKKINPELRDGLKAGQEILIPLIPKAPVKPATPKSDTQHKVEDGETLYSLAIRYGVSVSEIKKINPELSTDGLKSGDLINIPKVQAEVKQPTVEDKARLNRTVAQEQMELPGPDDINIENYYVHKVIAGETAYSLSKKYHISLDSLYSLNPGTEQGLRLGQRLKLPPNRSKYGEERENPQSKDELNNDRPEASADITDTTGDFFLYQLKTGDSFFSLKSRFDVSSDELIRLNPEVKSGLNVDKYIIIPKKKKEVDVKWLDRVFSDVDSNEPLGNPSENKVLQKDELNQNSKTEVVLDEKPKRRSRENVDLEREIKIGLMLPFMARTDTSFDYSSKVPQSAHYVLDFYNGILMAADTLAKQGARLNLRVYDTQNSLYTLREKIYQVEDENFDMIIGPLFQKNVHYVADKLRSKDIPVISPLSKTVSLDDRPNLIKCTAASEAGAQEIADLLNQSYSESKVVFAHTGSMQDREKVRRIKARLMARVEYSYIESIVSVENMIDKDRLTDILAEDRHNVVVVFSEDKVFLSDLVAKLYSMKEVDISLIGPPKLLQIPTLELSYLNHLNLTMTDANFVDYGSAATIDFVEKYKARYGAEPSQMAFQGYDVAMYFISQLWESGPSILDYLDEEQVMLGTGFRLTKMEHGGYQNDFVHITGIRDFTLVKVKPEEEVEEASALEGVVEE